MNLDLNFVSYQKNEQNLGPSKIYLGDSREVHLLYEPQFFNIEKTRKIV